MMKVKLWNILSRRVVWLPESSVRQADRPLVAEGLAGPALNVASKSGVYSSPFSLSFRCVMSRRERPSARGIGQPPRSPLLSCIRVSLVMEGEGGRACENEGRVCSSRGEGGKIESGLSWMESGESPTRGSLIKQGWGRRGCRISLLSNPWHHTSKALFIWLEILSVVPGNPVSGRGCNSFSAKAREGEGEKEREACWMCHGGEAEKGAEPGP